MTQDFIRVFLQWLMSWFPAPTPTPPAVTPASRFNVVLGPTVLKEIKMPESTAPASLAVALVDDQKQFIALTPGNDSQGNPGKLQSVPVWTSSDESVCSVSFVAEDGTTPVTDGLSGFLVSGKPGTAIVKVTAEGDVVVGKAPLELDLNVAVSAGDPTSLGATLSPPAPK